RLSTNTCCPRILVSGSCRKRAIRSVDPPAGYGTTRRMGFEGYVSAFVAVVVATTIARPPSASSTRLMETSLIASSAGHDLVDAARPGPAQSNCSTIDAMARAWASQATPAGGRLGSGADLTDQIPADGLFGANACAANARRHDGARHPRA